MYKSIMDIIHTDMEIKMEGEIMKAVQRCNIEVDKDELLKALQYDRGQYDKGYQDGLNADKWIPCEERLPNNAGIYLATYVYENAKMVDIMFFGGKNFYYPDDMLGVSAKFVEVIAWQPLPQPYKKEGAE